MPATDISFMFAAYVNEQHPFVDKMLREALDYGIVDSFTGYQSDDPAEVYRQVYALWHALSQRDVRYSNITTSAAETRAVSQPARAADRRIDQQRPGQLRRRQRAVGFAVAQDRHRAGAGLCARPLLPGLLSRSPSRASGRPGNHADRRYGRRRRVREIDGLERRGRRRDRQQDSWGTFCAAIAMGNKDLAANKDKFDDPADVNYQLVPIAAARQIGILPIAFGSDEEFTPTGE